MNEFYLVHYIEDKGEREYVAIISDKGDISEYCPDGFSVHQVIEIDGDCTTFPCDRLLGAE